ncbi:MAG: ADP-ribosylation factor-like protein [Phototrophicaceae bacterium]
MNNIFDTLVTVVIGTISGVAGTVRDGVGLLQDFFYVRVGGLPFIVLGARQVGKSTLIEWLRHNMKDVEGFEPDPTAAGGDEISDFTSKIGETRFKLKPTRDVGGEYAMWETDWLELFREAQPRGIIFVMDHTDIIRQKDALNFVMQMIEDEPAAAKNLRAFFVLVNKCDLWEGITTLDDIMANYRNEQKRLAAQAERVGYKYAITYGSLYTGKGVRAMMKEFFNVLRPRPRSREDL